MKYLNFRNHCIIVLLISIIVGHINCSKKDSSSHLDLTKYFSDFPIVQEKSQIILQENDYFFMSESKPETKKKHLPSTLDSGSRYQVRFFLEELKNYTIFLWCDKNISYHIDTYLNNEFVKSIKTYTGHQKYRIKIPKDSLKLGVNFLEFKYSPFKTNKRKGWKNPLKRITFVPVKRGREIGIFINEKNKKVILKGSLYCFFFIRTYSQSKMNFRCRKVDEFASSNKLEIRIENTFGEKAIQKINIDSNKWKQVQLNLIHFKNQIIRISFSHFSKNESSTEIKNPIIEQIDDDHKKRKVLLIGTDGATWKVINPLLKKNQLPNIKKLIESGVYGKLKTIKPWFSPIIWTSIVTGKKKEKHGIDAFVENKNKSSTLIIPNSRLNLKCHSIWDILSKRGNVVGIVGPWVTWPAINLNGYLLTDRIFYDRLPFSSFPPEFMWILEQEIKPNIHLVEKPSFHYLSNLLKSNNISQRSYLQRYMKDALVYLNQDKFKKSAGLYLNEIYKPDFFYIYLRIPDIMSHFFWKYYEPDKYISQNMVRAFGEIIPQSYIYHDDVIGQFLEKAGPNTTIVIVSDHGMQKSNYFPRMNFNKFKGLLKDIKILDKVEKYDVELLQLKPNTIKLWLNKEDSILDIDLLLSKLTIGRKKSKIFSILEQKEKKILTLKINKIPQIDYDSSVYFKGRKIGELSQYAHITDVNGDHSLYGIIIMMGNGIKKNHQLRRCSVLDITPTILYLIGLPIAKDMDGRVLRDAFTDEFLHQNPIRFIETYETEIKKKTLGKEFLEYNDDVKKRLLERLRTLGYIK
jgi:predicted AlkP superfamily phosphohydrolase/phosphomutase